MTSQQLNVQNAATPPALTPTPPLRAEALLLAPTPAVQAPLYPRESQPPPALEPVTKEDVVMGDADAQTANTSTPIKAEMNGRASSDAKEEPRRKIHRDPGLGRGAKMARKKAEREEKEKEATEVEGKRKSEEVSRQFNQLIGFCTY
jgi:hypothetical protein